MTPAQLRRWAYRCSALCGTAYAVYVLVMKFKGSVTGGPLGEVGEFLLVLACVSAFAIGLFADEAQRDHGSG